MNSSGSIDGLSSGKAAAPARRFWEQPAMLVALVLAAAIPLLWPAIPPLTDLPGHIARYHIQLNLDSSAELQRYYEFRWTLTGNLGVDLLMELMGRLFGVELGAKLIVICIPMMLTAGFLGVARELHGRIPPTAFLALPLAYHYAFQFGFVNFSLSAALCFLAWWLWLRLERLGKLRLRALLFIPLSCIIWVSHVYGWGILGVLAFASEAGRRRNEGAGWIEAAWRGALGCLPLTLPFLLMLIWRSGNVTSDTGGWFYWANKAAWLVSILRERWMPWDIAGASLLLIVALLALSGREFRMDLRARIAASLLLILFLLLPWVLIGSGYADMRMAAFVIAVTLLGIRIGEGWSERTCRLVAAGALLFFAARIAVTTMAFANLDASWRSQLAAVERIEPGSRVLVLAKSRCNSWWDDRLEHVSSLAVPRRNVFTNAQWTIPGGQLLQVRYRDGAPFVIDPSHLVRPAPCRELPSIMRQAVAKAPQAFDYLWLIGLPRSTWPKDPQLEPVWSFDRGILYRVRTAPNGTPTAG